MDWRYSNARDLRIVLLGQAGPWKGLVCRDLIGVTYDGPLCVQAKESGRKVRLVITKGWGSELHHYTDAAAEVMRSMSLCPPGPHALLLALPIGPDVGVVRRDVERAQRHMSFMSEKAWRHTMVVFVCPYRITADMLKLHRKTLEEILNKCEGKYSVVVVEKPKVALLQRIDRMARDNGRDFLKPQKLKESELSVFNRLQHNGFVFVLTTMLVGFLSGCVININFGIAGLNIGLISGLLMLHCTDICKI